MIITNYTSLCDTLDEMISQNEVTQMNGNLEFSICESLSKHFGSDSITEYKGIKITVCSEFLMGGQIVLHEEITDLITNYYK